MREVQVFSRMCDATTNIDVIFNMAYSGAQALAANMQATELSVLTTCFVQG
jgi:hypothetical protein